jgi:hypothetical protein
MRPIQGILTLAVAAAVAAAVGCTYSKHVETLQIQPAPTYPAPGIVYTPQPAAVAQDDGVSGASTPSLGMPTSTMPLGINEYTTLAPIDPIPELPMMDLSTAMPDQAASQPAATTPGVPDMAATAPQSATQPQYLPVPDTQQAIEGNPDIVEPYPQVYYPEPIYLAPQYAYEPSFFPVYYSPYQPYFCGPRPNPYCFWNPFPFFPGLVVIDHDHDHGHDGHGHPLPPVIAFPGPPPEKPHPPMVISGGSAPAKTVETRTVIVQPPAQKGAKPLVRTNSRVPDRENADKVLTQSKGAAPKDAKPALASPVVKPSLPVTRDASPRDRQTPQSIAKAPSVTGQDQPESLIVRPTAPVSNAPAKLPVITKAQPRSTAESAVRDDSPTPRARPIVTADRPANTPSPKPVARSADPVVARSDKPAIEVSPRVIVGAEREQSMPKPVSIARAPEPVIHREPVDVPAVRAPEVRSAPEPVRAAPQPVQVHEAPSAPAPSLAPAGHGESSSGLGQLGGHAGR